MSQGATTESCIAFGLAGGRAFLNSRSYDFVSTIATSRSGQVSTFACSAREDEQNKHTLSLSLSYQRQSLHFRTRIMHCCPSFSHKGSGLTAAAQLLLLHQMLFACAMKPLLVKLLAALSQARPSNATPGKLGAPNADDAAAATAAQLAAHCVASQQLPGIRPSCACL